MVFWFGYEFKELLFPSINVTTIAGLIAVCACTIGLVFILEASKIGLAYSNFYSTMLRRNQNPSPDCYTDDMFLVENHVPTNTTRYIWLLIEVAFYILEIILSYIVMLLVMTYNVYILLSVLFSVGIGYFLGGQILMMMKVKISKLHLPCNNLCTSHPKNSSITSSTEAISDNALNEEKENRCCLADMDDDDDVEEETKY